MAYNNRQYGAPTPPNNPPQFTTNPTRAKSQKWASAPKIDYGGDDWDEEEDDDLYSGLGASNQYGAQANNWNKGYGAPQVPAVPPFAPNRSMTMPLGEQPGGQGYAQGPVMGIARQGTLPVGGGFGGGAGGGIGSYGAAPVQRKPSKIEKERQAQEAGQYQQHTSQDIPRRSGEFIEDSQAENQPSASAVNDGPAKPAAVPVTPPRIRRPAEIYASASAQNSPVEARPRISEDKSPNLPNNDVPDVPQPRESERSVGGPLKNDEFGGELSKPSSVSPPPGVSTPTGFSHMAPTLNVPQPGDSSPSANPGYSHNFKPVHTVEPALLAPPGSEPAAHDTNDGGLSRSDTTQSKDGMSFAKLVSHAFSRKPQDSEDTTPQSGVDVQEASGNGADTSVSPILPRVSQELENIAHERAAISPDSGTGKNVQEIIAHPGSGSSSKLSSQAASPSMSASATFDRASGDGSPRTSPSHPSVAFLKDEGQRLGWRSVSPTQVERRSYSPVVVIPSDDQFEHIGAEKSVEWGVATPISIHRPNISPIETQETAASRNTTNGPQRESLRPGEAGISPANSTVNSEGSGPTKSPSFAAFLGQKVSGSSASAARSTSPSLSFKDFVGARSVSPNQPKSSSSPPDASPQISDSSATTPTAGATPRFKDFLLQKSTTASKSAPLGVQNSQAGREPSPSRPVEAAVGSASSPGRQRREEPPKLDTSGASNTSNHNESERLTKQIFSQLHYDSPQTASPQSPVKADAARSGVSGAPRSTPRDDDVDEPIKPLSTPPKQVSQFVRPSIPPQVQESSSTASSTQLQQRVSISPVTPPGTSDQQARQLHLHQPVPNPITRAIPPGSRFASAKTGGGEDEYEPSIADYQASTTSDYVPSPVETIQGPFSDRGKAYTDVPIILELRDIQALSDAQDRIRCSDKARELFASDHEGHRYRLQLWVQHVQSLEDRHPGVWGSGGPVRKMHKPRINPLLGPADTTANNQPEEVEGSDRDKYYGGWGSLDDNPRGSRPSTAYAQAEAQRRASGSQQAAAAVSAGYPPGAGLSPGQPPLSQQQAQQQQQQQQQLPGVPQPAGGLQNFQQPSQFQQQQQQQQPSENQRLAQFGQPPHGQQALSQAAQFSQLQQDSQGKSQQGEGHTSFKDKVDKVGGKVGKALPGLKPTNLKALFSKKKDKDATDHGGTRPQAADHIPESPQQHGPPAGNELQQLQGPPPLQGPQGQALSPGGARVGQGGRSVSDFPQFRKVVDQAVAGQNRSFSYTGQGPPPPQQQQQQQAQGQPAGTTLQQQPSQGQPSHQPTWHRQAQGAPIGAVPVPNSQQNGTATTAAASIQSAQGPQPPPKEQLQQQQQQIAPSGDTDGPPPLRRLSNSRPLPPKRASGAQGFPPPASNQVPQPAAAVAATATVAPAKVPQPAQGGQQYPPSSFNDPRFQQGVASSQVYQNYNQPQQQPLQHQQHQQYPGPHDIAPPPPPSTGYEPSFSNASIGSEKPKKRHSFFGSIGGQHSQEGLQPPGGGEAEQSKSGGKRISSSFFKQLKNPLSDKGGHHHTASDTASIAAQSITGQTEKRKKSGGFGFLKDLSTMDAFGKTDSSKKKEEARQKAQDPSQPSGSQQQPSPGIPKPGSSAGAEDPYVAKIYDSYTGTYMTYDEVVARDKAMEAGMDPPERPSSKQVMTPTGIFGAAQTAGASPYPHSLKSPQEQSFKVSQPNQNAPYSTAQNPNAQYPPLNHGAQYPPPNQSAQYPPSSSKVASAAPQQNVTPLQNPQIQPQWTAQTPIPQPIQTPQLPKQVPQQQQQPQQWGSRATQSIASISSSGRNNGPGPIILNSQDDDSTPPPLKKFSPSPSPPPRRSGPPSSARMAANMGLIRKISSPPPPAARFRVLSGSPPPVRQKHIPSSPSSGGFAVMAPPPSVPPTHVIQPGSSPVQRSPNLGSASPNTVTLPPIVSASGFTSPVPQPGHIITSGTPPTVSETAAIESPKAQDSGAGKGLDSLHKPEGSSSPAPSSPAAKPASPIPVATTASDDGGVVSKGKEKEKDEEDKEKENKADENGDASMTTSKINENNVPVMNSSEGQTAEPTVVEKKPQAYDFDEKIAVDPEGPVPEPEKGEDEDKVVMSATSGPDFGWEFY